MSVSDSKSLQVFRTLLTILAKFDNTAVWVISTRRLILKSSNHFINHMSIVASAPITTGNTDTFMFQSFFSSLARLRYLSLFSLSFNFTLWSLRRAKSTIQQVLIFLLTITRSSGVVEIR